MSASHIAVSVLQMCKVIRECRRDCHGMSGRDVNTCFRLYSLRELCLIVNF
jgi:hypothetical protein